ncbi:MAG: Xaa-Pro peptidase family protein, partial [Candidatus Omnitrophica bacterium]|nr:Xaa-Pro peptidase family protein [Candidatus Omnitrophota bacterium]
MRNCEKRLSVFSESLKRIGLDSFLVTNETNVSYLSGFEGRDSFLFFSGKKRFFLTDSRYIEEAAVSVKGFDMELVESSTYENLERLIRANRARKIGFEAMNLVYEVAARLKGLISNAEFIPVKGLIEGMRAIKERAEVKAIKEAVRLNKKVLGRVVALIRPGVTERYLRDRIETEFIKNGARAAFEPIIASGPNSSRPHARAGDDKIRKDSVVMIDIGCRLGFYNSDLTRMVFTGASVKEK